MSFYRNTNSGITQIINNLNDELAMLYTKHLFSVSTGYNNGWKMQLYCTNSSDREMLENLIKQYCEISEFGIKSYYKLNYVDLRVVFRDEILLDKFRSIVFSKCLE